MIDHKHDQNIRQIIYHDWSEKRQMTEDQLDKLKMLRPLRAACKECKMCRLGRMEHTHDGNLIDDPHVFSNMNPSRYIIVGQNPGHNECLKDEPFVGAAGEFFDQILEENGLSRNDFYISNTVRCHSPENRKPENDEVESCLPFLLMELKTLRPILIITLGAVAFEALCPGINYSDNLGTIIKSKYGNVYPVYHPSPRNMADQGRKSRFESDIAVLCKLIKRLRNPIVEA